MQTRQQQRDAVASALERARREVRVVAEAPAPVPVGFLHGTLDEFREFLEQDEFDLAWDALAAVAERNGAPAVAWEELAGAARLMSLADREAFARGKVFWKYADYVREMLARLPPKEQPLRERLISSLEHVEFAVTAPVGTTPPLPEVTTLQAALTDRRYRQALDVLDRLAAAIPQPVANYLRGRCWEGLLGATYAVPFYFAASVIDPGNVNFAYLFIHSLLESGLAAEARRWAEAIHADPNAHPRLLIKAADVYFILARDLFEAEQAALLHEVVAAVDTALDIDQRHQPPQLFTAVKTHAWVQRGMALEILGRDTDAIASYDAALAEDPDNDAALTARGLLLLTADSPRGIADLRRAAELGTGLVWPYFYLAHHALSKREHTACITLCQQALATTQDASFAALLYEWSAIALAEMRGVLAADQVRRLFNDALAVAPWSLNLQRNIAAFEKWLQEPDTHTAPPLLTPPDALAPQDIRAIRLRQQQERVRGEALAQAA